MTELPVITLVEHKGTTSRYRISGGDIADSWRKSLRQNKTPWCEFSVDAERKTIVSFGGEVWLSAWPDLFFHPHTNLAVAFPRPTDKCWELIAKAEREGLPNAAELLRVHNQLV